MGKFWSRKPYTPDQVREIFFRIHCGQTTEQIARDMGISYCGVAHVRAGYKHRKQIKEEGLL